MEQRCESPAATNLRNALRTSATISRLVDQPLPPPSRPLHLGVVPMAEPASSGVIGALLAKLLPAGLGAALMVAVDPPDSKRELFARLFVAFACSLLFGEVMLDLLHSFAWLSFLDEHKRTHTAAIDALCGALGWFVLGGLSTWLKRFRADPTGAVQAAREAKGQ